MVNLASMVPSLTQGSANNQLQEDPPDDFTATSLLDPAAMFDAPSVTNSPSGPAVGASGVAQVQGPSSHWARTSTVALNSAAQRSVHSSEELCPRRPVEFQYRHALPGGFPAHARVSSPRRGITP
jgi:hypothetical protein